MSLHCVVVLVMARCRGWLASLACPGRVHTTRDQHSRDVLRGEAWAFDSFRSDTKLSVGTAQPEGANRVLLEERMLLRGSVARPLADVLGGGEAYATVVLFGPRTLEVQLDALALTEALATSRSQQTPMAASKPSQSRWPRLQQHIRRTFHNRNMDDGSEQHSDDLWLKLAQKAVPALGALPLDCSGAWHPPAMPVGHLPAFASYHSGW